MQIRTRQRGNCSTLAGKSRGGTPFCRMLKNGFSKSRIFCKGFPLQLFLRNSCKIFVFSLGFTKRGGLVRPASKSCRFSHHPLRVPKAWHGNFAACGQRSGLLAHTSPVFLKNCWIKKLLFACGSYLAASSKNSLFSAIYILAIDFP